MYEFVTLEGRALDTVSLISPEKLLRYLRYLDSVRFAIDAPLSDWESFGLSISYPGGGLTRIPFGDDDGTYRLAERLHPEIAPVELRLGDGAEAEGMPGCGTASLGFGSPPWRVTLDIDTGDSSGYPAADRESPAAKPLCPPVDVPGSNVASSGVFRIRAPREAVDRGAAVRLVATFDESGERETIGEIALAREDGVFLSSGALLLLGAPVVPQALASTFLGMQFLPGLLGGGSGGAKKPIDVAVQDDGGTTTTETKVVAHIFRADDNGGFWSEGLGGNIDFDDEEARAPQVGWEDSDENPFATKEEILAHLAMMDGDDIWVYSGHLGYRQPDDPTQSDNQANYLAGWGFSEYSFISRQELTDAMGGESPGLVILSGCGSWNMRDTFAGSRIFAGFTGVVDDKESDATAKRFLNLLWNGQTVAQAQRTADGEFARMFSSQGTKVLFKVECADKGKRIYELLGVPPKPK